MDKIKLTQGKFAIVDSEDFEYLNQWKWHYAHGYARTSELRKSYMHRLVNKTPKGFLTDHINRNKLDNRKCNLRTGNKGLNSINRGLQSNNTSGYKGVSWAKNVKKWETYIWINGVKKLLGYFELKSEAVMVRRKAEKTYHAI